MMDGYTEDFRKDFVDYFTNDTFARQTAPPAFFDLDGRGHGIDDLLKNGNITFETATGSDRLNSPGVYSVQILADFPENWKFFKDNGDAQAKIRIRFEKIGDPGVSSPLYFIPLDGRVGLVGNAYSRQGYGTVFDLENPAQEIPVLEDPSQGGFRIYPDLDSNPLLRINASTRTDLGSLNTFPQSRGVLLSIDGQPTPTLTYAPSIPTPILLKTTQETVTNQPVHSYFSPFENGTPVQTGAYFGYWNGGGQCLNFDGSPIRDSFNYTVDRKADSSDASFTPNPDTAYALDWTNVSKPGNVYLYSILYSSPQNPSGLLTTSPSTQFRSNYQDYAQSLQTNTAQQMPVEQQATSIQKILGLLAQKKVCVIQTMASATYYWDENSILHENGNQPQSIMNEVNALVPGESCIGTTGSNYGTSMHLEPHTEPNSNYIDYFEVSFDVRKNGITLTEDQLREENLLGTISFEGRESTHPNNAGSLRRSNEYTNDPIRIDPRYFIDATDCTSNGSTPGYHCTLPIAYQLFTQTSQQLVAQTHESMSFESESTGPAAPNIPATLGFRISVHATSPGAIGINDPFTITPQITQNGQPAEDIDLQRWNLIGRILWPHSSRESSPDARGTYVKLPITLFVGSYLSDNDPCVQTNGARLCNIPIQYDLINPNTNAVIATDTADATVRTN
ncbi:MAG: hypothetical protein HY917_01850 [Candidatus Diapherotrites archaeon]|nr:hypothetical protein [Candidatus Diapherotrites archaeon]